MISPKEFLHSLIWTKRHILGELDVVELKYIRKYIKNNDICLDIGAHAGSWAIPLSKITYKGHVYGFEALPYYANVLNLMVRYMNRRNITIVNNAVLDKNCSIPIINKDKKGNELTGYTHIKGTHEDSDISIIVSGITIDSFIKNHSVRQVGLIKCDVEGAELLVLRGAQNTIQKWRPIVFCEIVDEYCGRYGYSSHDIFDFFDNYNYNSFIITKTGGISSINANTYRGNDALFLPAENNV